MPQGFRSGAFTGVLRILRWNSLLRFDRLVIASVFRTPACGCRPISICPWFDFLASDPTDPWQLVCQMIRSASTLRKLPFGRYCLGQWHSCVLLRACCWLCFTGSLDLLRHFLKMRAARIENSPISWHNWSHSRVSTLLVHWICFGISGDVFCTH